MKPSIEEYIVSTKELSRLLKKSDEAVRKWTLEGMAKIARGKYLLLSAHDWFMNNKVATDADLTLIEERRLHEKAKRERTELRLQQERGELVLREESLLWVGQLIVECRSNLLNLPHRLSETLALESDSRVVQEILRKEVRQILTILYEGKKVHEKKVEIPDDVLAAVRKAWSPDQRKKRPLKRKKSSSKNGKKSV